MKKSVLSLTLVTALILSFGVFGLFGCDGGSSGGDESSTASCTETSIDGLWTASLTTGGANSEWVITLAVNGNQITYTDDAGTQIVSFDGTTFVIDYSDAGLDTETGTYTVHDNCTISLRVVGENLNDGSTWDNMGTCSRI